MKHYALKFLAAIFAGFTIYWAVRFGALVGSLTTVRAELYFTLNGILAWFIAILTGLLVMTSDWKRP